MVVTAAKILQLVDETVLPHNSVSRGIKFDDMLLRQQSNAIVELPTVGLETLPSSATDSHESPDGIPSLSPDSIIDENFDLSNMTFSFDTILEAQ